MQKLYCHCMICIKYAENYAKVILALCDLHKNTLNLCKNINYLMGYDGHFFLSRIGEVEDST